jgi:hypothetical protein
MESVTYTKKVVVPIEDVDGEPISVGSVLRCVDKGDKSVGVVERIVDKDERRTYFGTDGPVAHGDLVISLGIGHSRVTNRYSHWKHVPRCGQTFRQRFESWCVQSFEFDEDGIGKTPDEQLAIKGLMSLFPEDPVEWDDGPIPYTFPEALAYMVDYLEELKEKADMAEENMTKFIPAGEDSKGRKTFTCTTSEGLFVDVDGILHTTGKDGEPLFSLRLKTPEVEK